MFLHAGNNFVINEKDIIGIFDMDNTTVSHQGRDFLPNAQRNNKIINASEGLPRSYIVTSTKGETKVYLSSISSMVLAKRANSKTAQGDINDFNNLF